MRWHLIVLGIALAGCQQVETDPVTSPKVASMEGTVSALDLEVKALSARVDAMQVVAENQSTVPVVLWQQTRYAEPGAGPSPQPSPIDTFSSRNDCLAAARADISEHHGGGKDTGPMSFFTVYDGYTFRHSLRCLPVGVDPRDNPNN